MDVGRTRSQRLQDKFPIFGVGFEDVHVTKAAIRRKVLGNGIPINQRITPCLFWAVQRSR
jgi:hypothetical protein